MNSSHFSQSWFGKPTAHHMLSLPTRLDQISTHQPAIGDFEQDNNRLEMESRAAALDAMARASPACEYTKRAGRRGAHILDAAAHGHGRVHLWRSGERHSSNGVGVRVWKRAVRQDGDLASVIYCLQFFLVKIARSCPITHLHFRCCALFPKRNHKRARWHLLPFRSRPA
jgi:hypothetical protein